MGQGMTEFERHALTLIASWRAKAADYLRISKAYKCRSMEGMKTAYLKQSTQLRMCAEELEATIGQAHHAETADHHAPAAHPDDAGIDRAMGKGVDGCQAPDGQSPAGEEHQDQGAGQVDLPDLRTDHGSTGRGPQDPAQPRRQRGRRQPAEPVSRSERLPRGEEQD